MVALSLFSKIGQVGFQAGGYLCSEIQKNMEQRPATTEEYQRKVNILVEYINNHLSETIDLDILAEMSGFSPWHFHRIVKAFLGENIGAFIVRMRVETAARLLRHSDMPVQEISWRVGYDVPSSLSKVFKQFYGISPNGYRKNKDYIIMRPLEIRHDLKIEAEVKELPACQIAYLRLSGAYMNLDYCGAWQKLWGFVKEQNLFSEGIEHICIYHNDPKVTEPDKLRTDVCLILPKPAEPRGEIGVRQLPGGKYAVYRYQGSYEHLKSVYDTVYSHLLPEGGYKPADSPGYEKYLNNPANTAPEELMTEIYVPVE